MSASAEGAALARTAIPSTEPSRYGGMLARPPAPAISICWTAVPVTPSCTISGRGTRLPSLLYAFALEESCALSHSTRLFTPASMMPSARFPSVPRSPSSGPITRFPKEPEVISMAVCCPVTFRW